MSKGAFYGTDPRAPGARGEDERAPARPRTVRAAIVGGTGYGGMELLRLLLEHPHVKVTAITSRSESGPVGEVHPHLRGFTELQFSAGRAVDLARENDVLFFATPHGVSAREAPAVLDAAPAVRVVDLSGDFRLDSAEAYLEHYGKAHPHPGRLADAVYGAVECGRRADIAGARLVANPGCHAYATLLAVWPLAQAGLVAGRVAVASVTGSSGSGASPSAGTHHPERFANFRAYKPLQHQHVPEIERALRGEARIDFVPHSAPLARGIHVTAFVPVPEGREQEAVQVVRSTYAGEPFVRLVPGTPDVRAVAGSNFADVGLTAGAGLVVVTVAIDNLVKGMAGTAVQNMNLALGLPETAGLRRPGLGL